MNGVMFARRLHTSLKSRINKCCDYLLINITESVLVTIIIILSKLNQIYSAEEYHCKSQSNPKQLHNTLWDLMSSDGTLWGDRLIKIKSAEWNMGNIYLSVDSQQCCYLSQEIIRLTADWCSSFLLCIWIDATGLGM